MRYGLPYQGSKNAIAEWVVRTLPRSHTLVDLFAGGCAVTHAALLSGKWERIIANDRTDSVKVFFAAINGEFDFDAFDAWLGGVDFPVYVSEYEPPAGCVEIARTERSTSMAANGAVKVTERIFVQERFADLYEPDQGALFDMEEEASDGFGD